jgi:hypothetical protein
VVVWRVDRLGRSLVDVKNTANLLRERPVQFGRERPSYLGRADDAELLGLPSRVRARANRGTGQCRNRRGASIGHQVRPAALGTCSDRRQSLDRAGYSCEGTHRGRRGTFARAKSRDALPPPQPKRLNRRKPAIADHSAEDSRLWNQETQPGTTIARLAPTTAPLVPKAAYMGSPIGYDIIVTCCPEYYPVPRSSLSHVAARSSLDPRARRMPQMEVP